MIHTVHSETSIVIVVVVVVDIVVIIIITYSYNKVLMIYSVFI